jgi:hypothetical protein
MLYCILHLKTVFWTRFNFYADPYPDKESAFEWNKDHDHDPANQTNADPDLSNITSDLMTLIFP